MYRRLLRTWSSWSVLFLCSRVSLGDVPSPIQVEDYQGAIRVACVGDSITAGVGAKAGASYPVQLGAMLGSPWEVGNFGVSNATLLNHGDLPYQQQRAFRAALDYQPHVVIICLGANDTKPLNWKFNNAFAADYKGLIEKFAALPSKPRIFLCHPIPVSGPGNYGITGQGVRQIIPMIDEIAREVNAGVIDMFGALRDHPETLRDHVHPNAVGAWLMAKAAYKTLTGKDHQGKPPWDTRDYAALLAASVGGAALLLLMALLQKHEKSRRVQKSSS